MPIRKLREFLDSNGVKYVTIIHSRAYTAQEIAALAHISGNELAKTVMLKLDGSMAMAVLPGSRKVDLDRVKALAGAAEIELASERDFQDKFPDCEVGAMPPFGNLYGMTVFLDASLKEDEEISFNAGSHTELIRLPYMEFERLAGPIVGDFATA